MTRGYSKSVLIYFSFVHIPTKDSWAMNFALQSSYPGPWNSVGTEMACALADELLFSSSSCWRHPFSRHFTFPSLSTNYCLSYVSPTYSLSFFLGLLQSERRGSYLCCYRLKSPLAFSVIPMRFFCLLNFLSHVFSTLSLTPTWTLYSFAPTFLNKGNTYTSHLWFHTILLPPGYVWLCLTLMTASVIVDIRNVDIKSCQTQNTSV